MGQPILSVAQDSQEPKKVHIANKKPYMTLWARSSPWTLNLKF